MNQLLSDEQIKAAVLQVTNDMLDHIYENGTGSEFVIRCMVKAARAIESAACAERDKQLAELEKANAAFFQRQDWWNRRMVELEQELEAVRKDAERLDWLDAQCSEGNGRHVACLPGGLRAAIDAMKEKQ